MINVEMLDSSVAVIRPQGKLAASDFDAIAARIDPAIAVNGKLNGLIVEAPKFPGWENLSALITHLKFIGAHKKAVRRLALVTDAKIARVVPRLASPFLTPEIRLFPTEQAAEARTWAAQA